MPRQRKATPWSIVKALHDNQMRPGAAAESLGVGRTQFWVMRHEWKDEIEQFLDRFRTPTERIPTAEKSVSPPRLTYLEQLLGDPLTAEELHRLASHGWTKHDCPGEYCPACLKTLDIEEPDKPTHLVDPASFGLAPRRTTAPAWASYAYKGRRYGK